MAYLALTVQVKFDDFQYQATHVVKPDFYGKNVNVLDRLIEIGLKRLCQRNSYDAFIKVVAKILFLVT